jgi:hypothetical protein
MAEVSGHAAPFTPLPDTYVVRLVRYPIDVITSVVHRRRKRFTRRRSEELVGRYIPEILTIEDPVERAGVYWVRWNQIITADETIRLEDVDQETVTRLARIAEPKASLATLPSRLNQSEHAFRPVQWQDIEHIEGLTDAMLRYGYDLP